MSAVGADGQPVRFYVTEEHHPQNGTLLGFWLYLMSDCLVSPSQDPIFLPGRRYGMELRSCHLRNF